jgi:hypothetical protein
MPKRRSSQNTYSTHSAEYGKEKGRSITPRPSWAMRCLRRHRATKACSQRVLLSDYRPGGGPGGPRMSKPFRAAMGMSRSMSGGVSSGGGTTRSGAGSPTSLMNPSN